MTSEPFTLDGKRKYLTAEEQGRFMAAANAHERAEVRTLCLLYPTLIQSEFLTSIST